MRKFYYCEENDSAFTTVDQPQTGSWIHIDNANEDDIKYLAQLLTLTTEDVDDALDLQEIPRIEHEDDKILIFVRNPAERYEGMYTQPLTIILANDYLVTITPATNQIVDKMLSMKSKYATTQRSKFLLHLLLQIANSYTREIKSIKTNVQAIENRPNETNNQDIIDLTKNELILNEFLTSLVPLRNVFESVLTGKHFVLNEDDNDLLEDLLITIRQSVDICTVNVKGIRTLRDAYQIVFTNNLNRTIKLLTSFTIVLTIPTVMASVYGMNINLPFATHPFAFLLVAGITGFLSFGAIIIFRRLKWL